MILYNVTVSVDPDIEKEWINWMKKEHIDDVMKTGYFIEHKFLKLLNDAPDANGITYAIQYFAEKIGDLDEYLKTQAPILQKAHQDKFRDKFVAFRTVLEEV